ncbi:MAG: hypothetical protein IPJ39_21795 [Saprospiraceae bacterium]|nr:hypothetical protein [Saprospiraceae bacterium]
MPLIAPTLLAIPLFGEHSGIAKLDRDPLFSANPSRFAPAIRSPDIAEGEENKCCCSYSIQALCWLLYDRCVIVLNRKKIWHKMEILASWHLYFCLLASMDC